MASDPQMWTCVCGDGGMIQMDIDELVEHSGYFSAMMNSQMRETRERQLQLPLFMCDTICFLLNVFSHRDKSLSAQEMQDLFSENMCFDNIEDLLHAADYLFMPCLYPLCCEMLNVLVPSYCVSIARVWRMWEACQMFGLQATKSELCRYIAKNMRKINDLDVLFFREIPMKLLAGVLCMPEIDISSELDIIRYIDEWILYFKDGREENIDTLFKCIHIPSLIHSDLTHLSSMLIRYDATDKAIWNMFSLYVKNPLKFFVSRPELSMVRNEQNVIMLFGGINEQNLLPHNVQLNSGGRRRRTDVCFHPLMYQDIDEVRAKCLNCGERQQKNLDMEKQAKTFEISTEKKCGKCSGKKWQKSVGGRKRKSSEKKRGISWPVCNCDQSPDTSPTTASFTETNGGTSQTNPHQSNGLKLKQISRLRTAMKLVEFGICSYRNFVFVAGGQRMFQDESKCSVRGAHRLDPHIGEWSEIGMMKESRCLFYMTEAWNRLYAVGGANQYGVLRSIEYYIPEEDQWYYGQNLPNPLHEHAGCVFDNKMYISGGHDDTSHTDKVWVLHDADSPWKPCAPMLQPRSYHGMAALGDHIYVVGGCSQVGESIRDNLTMEQYDPKTDTWTKILTLNVPVSCSSPVVIDDEMLFVGVYCFNQKQFLQQTVAIDTKQLTVRMAPLEFAGDKRIVGYQAFKMKTKKKVLK